MIPSTHQHVHTFPASLLGVPLGRIPRISVHHDSAACFVAAATQIEHLTRTRRILSSFARTVSTEANFSITGGSR